MSKGKCGFCGENFDNVFEAVDHLDDRFTPTLITSARTKLDVGEVLYTMYQDGDDKLKKIAEELFSSLYVAEKRPEYFEHYLIEHDSLFAPLVYRIITEDSWKLAGQDE